MDQSGFDKLVWEEIQRQLKRKKGLRINKGSVQGCALLSDSEFHPSLCFRMQRSSLAEPDNATKDIHQGEGTKTCRNRKKMVKSSQITGR